MSKENRPNFHAVNFVTAMMTAFDESLRGHAEGKMAEIFDDQLKETFIEFAERVNDHVDEKVSS